MHIILEGNTLSPSFNYQPHHLSQHLHHLSITTSPAQHCCPHQTATSQTKSSSPSTSRNSTEYSKLKVNNRIGTRISCSLEFCTCRLILQWNVQVYPHSIELDCQIPHISLIRFLISNARAMLQCCSQHSSQTCLDLVTQLCFN